MKKEQLAIREQALLNAALNCFATERCEDVTVARIAKLAGVAKGTVYLHFTSKDEICARLAQDFHDGLAAKYKQISGNGITRLKKIVEVSFSHYQELQHYRHIVQYCYREHFLQSLKPEIAQSLRNIGSVRRQHIAQALALGTTDQSMMSDAKLKLIGICCTVEGMLQSYSDQENTGQYNQIEFIDSVTHYILSTVGQHKTIKPATKSSAHPPELMPEV